MVATTTKTAIVWVVAVFEGVTVVRLGVVLGSWLERQASTALFLRLNLFV